MNRYATLALAGALASLLACAPAHADDAAAETRWQVGLSYASGLSDLRDKLEANNPGLTTKQLLPLGLTAAVYRDFGNGMAIGGSIGPAVVATGDVSFTIIPLALDLRYVFSRGEKSRIYGRLGVEKAFVSGDLVSSGSTGGVLGVGMEFAAPGRSGWGVEATLHSTQVNVNGNLGHRAQEARPYAGSLGVFFAF